MGLFSRLQNRVPVPGHCRRQPSSAQRWIADRLTFETLEDRCLPSGFGLSASYAAGANAQAVATVDVNHDGALDLVTAGTGGVAVLLGKVKNGTPAGTFAAPQNYAVGSASSLAVGDINGDGNADIVTGSGGVLLGNGNGAFSAGPGYAGALNDFVFLTDVNGDGKRDLVTANHGNVNLGGATTNVSLGNGNGTFQASGSYTTPYYIGAMAVGKFDGKLDIVLGTSGGMYLLPGNGDGTFQPAQLIGFMGGEYDFYAITTADFNGDGKLDLAISYTFTGGIGWSGGYSAVHVFVLPGNGDGSFNGALSWDYGIGSGPQGSWTLANSVGLAAADVNGDGKLDLVSVGGVYTTNGLYAGPEVSVLFGNGNATFGGEVDYLSQPGGGAVSYPTCLAAADFNGDGHAEVAVIGATTANVAYIDVLSWSTSKKK